MPPTTSEFKTLMEEIALALQGRSVAKVEQLFYSNDLYPDDTFSQNRGAQADEDTNLINFIVSLYGPRFIENRIEQFYKSLSKAQFVEIAKAISLEDLHLLKKENHWGGQGDISWVESREEKGRERDIALKAKISEIVVDVKRLIESYSDTRPTVNIFGSELSEIVINLRKIYVLSETEIRNANYETVKELFDETEKCLNEIQPDPFNRTSKEIELYTKINEKMQLLSELLKLTYPDIAKENFANPTHQGGALSKRR